MKSVFQYKVPIKNNSVDTIVKEKCQQISQKVKRSKQNKTIHDYPAVVVGCCAKYRQIIYIDSTSSRKVYSKVPTLYNALNTIGGIGTLRNGNIIGACAEPKAAFDVVLDVHCALQNLRFSKAFRPRTLQVIPYCQNCKDVFKL